MLLIPLLLKSLTALAQVRQLKPLSCNIELEKADENIDNHTLDKLRIHFFLFFYCRQ